MKLMNQAAKYGVGTVASPPASRRDVKAAIGCCDTTFWRLLKAGEFKNAFRVGREVRVPWQDIVDYKAKHRINA